MRIVIVTDAWAPQVNGVVRTLQATKAELEAMGHRVMVISPDLYDSIPCPTYPEIRLARATAHKVGQRIAAFGPDAIHLSTEGPLCLAARRWCLAHDLRFTTAYHTQFPEYVSKRTRLPASLIWRYIRWFHSASSAVLVSTATVRAQLTAQGIGPVKHWGRGVDLNNFSPDAAVPALFASLPRPIQLYVGRVSVEKNIEAFLHTSHPGSKVIVGDGPARARLETQFPEAHFLGSMSGRALAGAYAGADVFVFPSKTDTFGLVMIEAMACGTPVAAYPVSGPLDIVTAETGRLNDDLSAAISGALLRDRSACLVYGRQFSWSACSRQFVKALVSAHALGLETRHAAA
jgi:glycosyltransferase involved in cell wall biosynthesis